jgi:hypothetical protein
MALRALSDRWGKSQRTMGAMMREERWKDIWSPEAEKITHIQTNPGSQRPRRIRLFGTAHGSRGLRGGATGNVWVAPRPRAEP